MASIASLEKFLVAPRWLFVRIETSDGVVGWGEATCEAAASWSGWSNPIWRYDDGGFAEW